MSHPKPFTIVRPADGPVTASNGQLRLTCLEADGAVALRRGVRGALGAPPAEKLLAGLNALAGDVLQRLDMPPEEVAARLHALQMACNVPAPVNLEWAYVRLGDVYVYTDGTDVVVTRQDLQI